MTQPRRPAETQTPQLTDDQVRTRAQNAFNTVVNGIIQTRFSQRPPAAEMAAITAAINRLPQDADITPAIEQYARSNPNSTIAKYFNFTGSTGWLLTPTGTVGFNQNQLAADVRTALTGIRTQVATSFVELYHQAGAQNPSFTFSDIPFSSLGPVGTALVAGLVQQTNSGPNAIPVFIASVSQNMTDALRIALKESKISAG